MGGVLRQTRAGRDEAVEIWVEVTSVRGVLVRDGGIGESSVDSAQGLKLHRLGTPSASRDIRREPRLLGHEDMKPTKRTVVPDAKTRETEPTL